MVYLCLHVLVHVAVWVYLIYSALLIRADYVNDHNYILAFVHPHLCMVSVCLCTFDCVYMHVFRGTCALGTIRIIVNLCVCVRVVCACACACAYCVRSCHVIVFLTALVIK